MDISGKVTKGKFVNRIDGRQYYVLEFWPDDRDSFTTMPDLDVPQDVWDSFEDGQEVTLSIKPVAQ